MTVKRLKAQESNFLSQGFASVDLVKIIAILGSIFTFMSFLGGKTFGFLAEDRKLVDKPYVDERLIASKLYTDEKAAQILKESNEHSDRSRQDMTLKMEQMNSETRTNHSVVQTKLDFMLNSIEQIGRNPIQQNLSQVNDQRRMRASQ